MREAVYRFGDVTVEAAGREVRRAGVRVPLEPKALDVLLILLADAGRVVDKRRLLREVWADVHVTDSSLARAITQVRRALGDDHKLPRYVETVPTRGYRFIGSLERTTDDANPGLDSGPLALPSAGGLANALPALSSRAAAPRRGAAAWVAGVLIVLAVVVGWFGTGGRRETWAAAATPGLGERIVRATSVAVQLTTSRGADVDPTWSPDGMQIAYASDASGAFEIMVRPRIGEAQVRMVTQDGGDNVSPTWSPDGQWLAYHSRRRGGIWIVPAAGGTPRQLVAEGGAPSWSPGGRDIAFQTAAEPDMLGGTGATPSVIGLVDVAGGSTRMLTTRGQPHGSHGRPVWLPSGDAIAFVSSLVPVGELWLVTRGGTTTRVALCSASTRPFTFTRAGTTWLGYLDGSQLGQLWLLPVTPSLDASRAQKASLPTTMPLSDLSVSSDGGHVAMSAVWRTSELWLIEAPGGDPSRAREPRALLDERRPRYGEPRFAPGGMQLAYSTKRAGDEPEAWIYDIATGTARRLGTPVSGFVKGWSPDGQHVLLVDSTRPRVIQQVDVVTGRAEPLLRLDGSLPIPEAARRMFTLRLSPDLSRYVHGASGDDGRAQLWLATRGAAQSPRRLNTAGDEADFPVWSRDGRRLAYQAARGTRTTLAVQDVDGGAAQVLVDDASHTWVNDWSPDSRFVVMVALRQGRWTLEAVDVRTRRVHRLTHPTDAAGYVRWPVWSPDGTRIVYERGTWEGNVWVTELPES